ncbi:MAG: hypothetical protein WCH39_01670 [Schlesneria sp.]
MQDLTANLSLDTSDFVGPILDAADKVKSVTASIVQSVQTQASEWIGSTNQIVPQIDSIPKTYKNAADEIETSNQQIITLIHQQETSWLELTKQVIPQITKFGLVLAESALKETKHLANVTLDCIPAVIQLSAGFLQVGAASGSTAGRLAGLTAALGGIGAAGAMVPGFWSNAGQMVYNYGGIISKTVGMFVPQWKIATAVIAGGLLAYKAANSEAADSVVQSAIKTFTHNEKISKSYTDLKNVASNLGDSLSRPFEGLLATGSSLAEMFNPIPSIVEAIAPAVSSTFDIATSAIETTNTGVTQLTDGFTALALSAADGNLFNAEKYYKEADALRELAKETERVLALQAQQKIAYDSYRDIQENAVLSAQRAEDVQAVGLAKTTAEIDSLRTQYQQLFAETTSGMKDGDSWSKDELQHIANITNAIERQALAIKAGRVQPTEADVKGTDFGEDTEQKTIEGSKAAANSYAQMTEELNKLNFGQEQAARMAIAASNATDDEVNALLALHDQIEQVTNAQKAQKETDRLAKSTTDQVNSLKDQIDELSGAYTKAEIAARKMLRAGHTEEQASQVASLQAELDKLREKDPAKKEKSTELSAALRGSKEANSITMRGVGGGSDPKVKLQQDANQILKTIAANTKPTAKSIKLLPANIRA